MANSFYKRGQSVELVLVNKQGGLIEEVEKEIDIKGLNCSRVLKSILPLRNYISNSEPSVVISLGMHTNIISNVAITLSGVPTKHIMTEHSVLERMSPSFKRTVMGRLAKLTYPRADAVVAVSKGVKQNLRELVGYKGPVQIIYNPVVSERLIRQSEEAVSDQWFNDDTKVILSAGRLASEKDIQTLLEAYNKLLQFEDDSRLAIIGEGPEKENLIKKSKQLGIYEDTRFLGFVDNIYKYMSQSSVFVLPSKKEGFGMVLVESLACGCPVVSTDCPSGPAEILDSGKYGRLVPVGDSDTMAAALKKSLNEPVPEKLLLERANDFSVNKSIKQYEDLMSDIGL
jgi:glycosyltransferase involved in cell wall biosynthesis